MGKRFTSFDDAWQHFLQRTEPMESFYAALPDDPAATIDRWIAEPPEPVRKAAQRLQDSFAALSWIAPVPPHFLHVTLRPGIDWSSVAPFEAEFGPVCSFPVAVVAEVRAPAVEEVVVDPFFLPHLSVGYVLDSNDPEPLRRALASWRGTALGTATIREVSLVRIPVAKSRLLEPWSVLHTVRLEPAR